MTFPGLILTGSGLTSVLTAPLFRPRQRIAVAGASASSQVLLADDAGRLFVTVDLGPAHTLEQGTAAEIAAATSNPAYFVTSAVAFHPLDVD